MTFARFENYGNYSSYNYGVNSLKFIDNHNMVTRVLEKMKKLLIKIMSV